MISLNFFTSISKASKAPENRVFERRDQKTTQIYENHILLDIYKLMDR